MSRIFKVLTSLFLLSTLLSAQEITLDEFFLLINDSVEISILQAEQRSNKATAIYEKQKLSPTLFATTNVSDFSNVPESSSYNVTTTDLNGKTTQARQTSTPTDQRFQRVSIRAGVFIPLSGSRDNINQDVVYSQVKATESSASIEVMNTRIKKELSYAYFEYYINQLKLKLTEDFLYRKKENKQVLQQRIKHNFILNSEKLEIETLYSQLENDRAMFTLRQDDARYKLALYTNKEIEAFQAVQPHLDTSYATELYLLSKIDAYPEVKLYERKLNKYTHSVSHESSWFSAARLEFGVGGESNFDGDTASSVYALLHIQTPFERIGNEDVDRKIILANTSKYKYELEKYRKNYKNAVKHNLVYCELKKQDLHLAHRYLDIALESYREQKLRSTIYKKKVFYNVFTSKVKVYKKTQDYLDAQLELFKAQAEILSLAEAEPTQNILEQEEVFYNANRSSILLQEEIIVSESSKLSWYSWYGFSLFKESQVGFFKELPLTKRIFLSLNAKELNQIQTLKYESNTLKELLHQCEIRNIEVELLLGDPTWLEKGKSKKLIKLIKQMSRYNFKGIQLDIEKEMLKVNQQEHWEKDLIGLIQAINRSSKLKIAISIHHRNANKTFLSKLKEAGLNEVVVMYYSKNSKNIISKMQSILSENPKLKCSVALSIEPVYIVEKEATFVNEGVLVAIKQWQNISKTLEKNSNFNDVVIQSLKYFYKVKHENKI